MTDLKWLGLLIVLWLAAGFLDEYFREQCLQQLQSFEMMADFDNRDPELDPRMEQLECN